MHLALIYNFELTTHTIKGALTFSGSHVCSFKSGETNLKSRQRQRQRRQCACDGDAQRWRIAWWVCVLLCAGGHLWISSRLCRRKKGYYTSKPHSVASEFVKKINLVNFWLLNRSVATRHYPSILFVLFSN